MNRSFIASRSALFLTLLLALPAVAAAATIDFQVLLDVDNNAATGCAVGGMSGVDQVIVTSVTTTESTGSVTSMVRRVCTGGNLGSPVDIDTSGWGIGFNPASGQMVVESRVSYAALGSGPFTMRIGFVAQTGTTVSSVLTRPNGQPILFPEASHGRRRSATPGNLDDRVFTLDGQTRDWGMIPPLGSNSSPGQQLFRLSQVYGYGDGQHFWFRADANLSANPPPQAKDDAYSVRQGQVLTIANPGVLANDSDPAGLPLTAVIVTRPAHGVLTLNSGGGFTYANDGVFVATDFFEYRATNGLNESNTAKVVITIVPNGIPQAVNDAYNVAHRGTLTVPAPGVLTNDSDPDGDPLSAFGLTNPANGTLALNPSGAFTYTHNGTNTLSDSFTYAARDGLSQSSPATVNITVAADIPPTAVADAYSVNEGATLNVAAPGIFGNDTDPDTPQSLWTAQVVTGPVNGTLTMGAGGAFTYVHNGGETTTDSFVYRINDGIANSANATVTISINPINDAPVAVNDAYNTNEDTPLNVALPGVLTNDTDAEGQTLTATRVANATSGNVTVNPNGSFTYTPNANFNGTDTFTYTATDASNAVSNTATVTITVAAVNDTPSFTAGGNVAVNEDSGAYNAAWATAVSPGPADESGQTVSFNVSNDNNGLFSAQPVISPAGVLTFTPTANANGTATVTVSLSDNGVPPATSASVQFTITVNAVNDAPSFTKGPDQTVNEDAPAQTVNPWATGISAGPADEAGQTLTFNLTNDNNALFTAGGQPAVSPAGVLTYTPAPNANGVANVTITLSDNGSNVAPNVNTSAAQTFVITLSAVNDAPVNTVPPAQNINEDVALVFSAGNGNAISVTDVDAGAAPFRATLTATNGTVTAATGSGATLTGNGTATLVIDGTLAQVNAALSGMTFTPAANYNGPASLQIVSSDLGATGSGGTLTDTDAVTITIAAVNDTPVFTPGANVTVDEDSGVYNAGWATGITPGGGADEAGQVLTFNVSNNNNALFTGGGQPAIAANGTLTFTPAPNAFGTATVTVSLSDNGVPPATSASVQFTITVNAVNDAPVLTAGGTLNYTENQAATAIDTTITVNDVDSANLVSATVQLTTNYVQGQDVLSYTPALGISGTFDGPTGTLSLTGTATLADWQTALRNVRYNNTSDDPSTLARTVVWRVNDGAALNNLSNQPTSTINVAAVNDPPTIIAGTTHTFTENGVAITLQPALSITDPDSANIVCVVDGDCHVDVVLNTDTGNETMACPACPGTITATWVPASNRLRFIGTDTVANFQTALRSVTWINTSENPNPLQRTLSWFVKDAAGAQSANTAQNKTFINVLQVNDEPSFTSGGNVLGDSTPGTQVTFNGWATGISRGAAAESAQNVDFVIDNYTSPGLFTVAPAVDASGNLTFTPVAGAQGTSTVTLHIHDDGGVANGGDDASPTQTFVITLDASPSVTTTTPANGATDIAGNTNITVNFSEPVNATGASFTISCTVSGAHTFALGGGGASWTLNPDTDFTQGETCTVTALAAQITDADTNDGPNNMLANYVFSFSIDAAPSVTAVTPLNGATQVATNTNLTVTFSEPVTITNSSVTINCGTSGAHTATVSAGPTTWTVNPDTDFSANETCTATVLAAQVADNDANDPPDNMGANFIWSFTTDAAPSVTATTPTNGSTTFPGTDITVTFSEAVNATGTSFTISCTTTGAHTFVLSGGPTAFTLNPDTDFTGGETCTVTVLAAQVTDQDAGDPPNNMAADHVFSFTVDAAPTVTATTPVSGAPQVASNSNVTVTFSESVNATGSSFTISCATSGAHAFALSASPNTTFTLNPSVDFTQGELCTVTVVAAQVTDADANDPPDNMASDYVFSFTVDQAPAVLSTTPANGATNQSGATNVDVTFSEAVTFAGGSFTINCTVSGAHTFALSGTSTSATLNPDTDFTAGETCTVTVLAAGVTDNDAFDPPNNMLANHVFSFTIDAAPSVTSTVPADTATNISTNSNLTLNFSESVTLTSAPVTITCANSGAHNAYTVSASPNTSFTIDPSVDFAQGELCTVVVLANQVSDSDANDPPDNLAANYTFTFTTDQAPSVTSTTPANAGIAAPNADVTINFSEAVNVTGSWFTITCGTSGAHTAVVTGGPTSYTLNPDTDFVGGETCNVSILAAQVTDQDAGDPPDTMGANHNFSFTVDGAPAVVSTNPANGATDRATNINIVITYDEPVTAGGTAYTINCSGAQAFVLSGNGTAVHTLDPNTNLPAGTSCTVSILAAQITDVDTNDPPDNMAANYNFSFTTDAAPSVSSTTPANAATGVTSNANLTINFSESVTLTAAGISCTVSGAHTSVISASPNTSFTVNPDTDFTQGETCTVTILSTSVTDTDANDPPDNMAANHVFSFTVDQQPSVTATTPTNGAVNQATNVNIVVTFSEAVTAPDAAFTINCGGAQAFTGSGSGTNTVTLDPTADLPAGTSCTVTVLAAQVADVDANDPPDNMAANYVFSFTTDAQPSVTTTTPTNGAVDIAKTSNIVINFSENVDVTASSFEIKCPASGGTRAFSFIGGTTGVNTVTLDPTLDLVSGELCQVTVFATQVADSDANDPPNNMAADHVFSFGVEPDAIDDTHPHTHVGNVPSNSATFFKVTTNDLSANAFTITAYDATTVNGGTIVMQTSGANMGEFTYNPPPGFEGADTFTYTINNAHGTDTATVTINVSGMVWFIDQNDGTGPFDGRHGSPFQTLAQFEAVNGNADVGNNRNPQANDNIFLYQSGTAYTGPVTLENGQKVIGQDSATAAFGAGSITGLTAAASQSALPGVNSGDGVFVNITSAGVGFTAAQNNQIRGLRFGNNAGGAITSTNIGSAPGLLIRDALINNGTGGGIDVSTGTIDGILSSVSTTGGARGLRLNAVNGTLNVAAGTITNATTAGIDITGENPTVTFSGTISHTNGVTGLLTSNMTGGSITLGTVNVSGTAAGNDGIVLDGSAAIPAIDLTITSATINNGGGNSDGIALGDLGSGSDVTITAGTITTNASTRRLVNFTGATNCNCNFSGVTFNGSSSDGLSLGATQLGTYQFGNTTMNTPNGGIGIQVVGDANSANTDSAVTFKRVDIATCTQKGIYVHSHSGSFTVLGNAGANSGGTISGCTQHGAKFGNSTSANTGAKNVSLTEMNFTGNGTANLDAAGVCGDASNGNNTNCAANIDLQQVNTVTLANLDVSGSVQIGINGRQVADLVMTNLQVNNNGNEALEDGIQLHNLTTTAQRTWSGLNIHDNTGRQIEVQNLSGSNDVVITSPQITHAVMPSATVGAQGILWSARQNGNVKVSITNGTFTRNYGAAVFTDVADAGVADVSVDGGTMTDNNLHFQVGMGGTTATGSLTYALKNLTSAVVNPATAVSGPIGILKGLNTTGNMTGTITGNTFGNPAVAFSGSPCISCVIIDVTNGSSDGGTHNVTISGNTFNQSGHQPIHIAGGGNGTDTDASTLRANITSNIIQNPADPISGTNPLGDQAIVVNIGSGAGDTTQACAHVSLNTITGSWADAAGGGRIRVLNRRPGTALRLPGFAGPFNDTTAAASFVSGQNGSVAATAQLQNGAVFSGGNPVPCF